MNYVLDCPTFETMGTNGERIFARELTSDFVTKIPQSLIIRQCRVAPLPEVGNSTVMRENINAFHYAFGGVWFLEKKFCGDMFVYTAAQLSFGTINIVGRATEEFVTDLIHFLDPNLKMGMQ